MDLVAFDDGDQANLTHELAGTGPPFWTGITLVGDVWTNDDGCTPYLPWATGEPSITSGTVCGLVATGGLVARACSATTESGNILGLCETPRPTPPCLAQAAQRTLQLLTTTPVSNSAAQMMCTAAGGHLVEIDSSDELAQVAQIAGGMPIWIGARYSMQWITPTTCPAVFSWAAGEPINLPTSACASLAVDGMHTADCMLSTFGVVCETNL